MSDLLDEAKAAETSARADSTGAIWDAMQGTAEQAFAEYRRVARVYSAAFDVNNRSRRAVSEAKAAYEASETATRMRKHDLDQAAMILQHKLTSQGETK